MHFTDFDSQCKNNLNITSENKVLTDSNTTKSGSDMGSHSKRSRGAPRANSTKVSKVSNQENMNIRTTELKKVVLIFYVELRKCGIQVKG